jgi:hypothetical protein
VHALLIEGFGIKRSAAVWASRGTVRGFARANTVEQNPLPSVRMTPEHHVLLTTLADFVADAGTRAAELAGLADREAAQAMVHGAGRERSAKRLSLRRMRTPTSSTRTGLGQVGRSTIGCCIVSASLACFARGTRSTSRRS